MAKDIKELTASRLQRAIDKASAKRSACGDALIAAGRGHELASETRAAFKSNPADMLAAAWCKAADAHMKLLCERERRERYHGSLKPIVVSA